MFIKSWSAGMENNMVAGFKRQEDDVNNFIINLDLEYDRLKQSI